jgi:hypothetical protein
MTRSALLARGAILVAIAIAALGHRAWVRAHPPTLGPLPSDTTYWQPTSEARLGGDSTFEFQYRRSLFFVDSRAGTVSRNGDRGPFAPLRLTRAERDSIKHAILASGFFDWPGWLGTPQPTDIPDIRDETGLTVRAGKLEHEVWRVDSFGREDEPPANREAKRRMSDLEQLIRGVVESKPAVKALTPPPPYW